MADHPRTVTSLRRLWVLNVAIGLGAVGMLGASPPAHALSCGDVVGPGGTATLDEDLICERSPALIAQGPVVLDLQGFTLACALSDEGTLAGTGIEVIGSQAEVRDGQVGNCRRGIHVKGDGHHLLKRLSVTSSAGVGGGEPIGFLVKSDHNRFIRNTVREYAGEGFRLDGANNNVLKRNKAVDNGDHGFRVRRGRRNAFLWNAAQRNGGEGFRSQDRDNRFESNTATYNGDEGIRLRDASAQNNLVTNNTVEHNGLSPCNPLADIPDVNPGIAVTRDAKNNKIKSNTIKNNCIGIAIEEGSRGNKIKKNKISNSELLDMVDGNNNCANNDWRKNKFKTSASGPFPPGIPFHPCMHYGNLVTTVGDQADETLEDGVSLAKDAGSAAEDAGSAIKDAAKSLF